MKTVEFLQCLTKPFEMDYGAHESEYKLNMVRFLRKTWLKTRPCILVVG
jgi:hypothetical protein